jgi:hypothetical protein
MQRRKREDPRQAHDRLHLHPVCRDLELLALENGKYMILTVVAKAQELKARCKVCPTSETRSRRVVVSCLLYSIFIQTGKYDLQRSHLSL